MEIEEFVSLLSEARKEGRGYRALCPAHADKHPSLSITKGHHGILLKCWNGCTFKEIIDAVGVSSRELTAPSQRGGSGFERSESFGFPVSRRLESEGKMLENLTTEEYRQVLNEAVYFLAKNGGLRAFERALEGRSDRRGVIRGEPKDVVNPPKGVDKKGR